ncbi:hypothetical protein N825_07400 [Skermanella stibiiresistens SB22]|uniref:Uncharacterized protein n=1 Tax=Skermanella stibiiresistens SB22 TaxID=1385369 RepID=W9GZC9_9PROT|nr:hypothetical protein [Skermanella stibiiresistens]EWY39285.1 hypothetical protein N825_07400 [Skermanella stibiiresistens SB22]
MGLSDIAKTMSPVRASYQARVQSQNEATEQVVTRVKNQQAETPKLMSASFDISNQGLRSRGGKIDIQV